jgi:Domain of unknown function (DUF4148)
MKATQSIVAMFVLSAAGAAFAGGGPYPEPAIPESGSVSRAQVISELREAQRLGLMIVGERDVPADPRHQVAATKSRAQVIAELREAQRLGLLNFGEGDAPVATAEQERLIADAGRRAAEPTRLAEHE